MDHSFIYIIHIIFAGPLLIYAGHIGMGLTERKGPEGLLFTILFVTGLIVLLYHVYKFYLYRTHLK